jgi:hypothetical protein
MGNNDIGNNEKKNTIRKNSQGNEGDLKPVEKRKG